MQFTSVSFLLFAAAVLLGYYLLPKKIRWCYLLAGSMFFYLMAGVEYLAFILLTAVSTYLTGLLMDKNLQKRPYLGLHDRLQQLLLSYSGFAPQC